MKHIKALAVATVVAALAAPAFAADYTMIMAHGLSDARHPLYQTFEKIKTDIEERSAGRIEVDHQPGSALGGDREIMESLMLGDIQFAPLGTSGAIQFIPEFAVFDLPYTLPPDTKTLKTVLNNSAFSNEIKSTLENKGIHFGGVLNGGFRNLTTAKTEVHKPEDIAAASLRLRVQENPVHIALWRDLGAAPTPIAFPELYGALQQGVVDGQENPYGHILSQRFYEVQGYLINTKHIFLANINLVNKEWFDSLPADLQQVVDGVLAETTDFQWELQDKAELEQREELQKHLKIIDLKPEEMEAFRTKTEGVAKLVRERAGDAIVDSLLESVKANASN
jgi:TRAP-type transport system periplasmic protein